jgi:hypothetical protein
VQELGLPGPVAGATPTDTSHRGTFVFVCGIISALLSALFISVARIRTRARP